MARAVLRTIVVGFAAASLLTACVEGGGQGGTGSGAAATSAPAKKAGKGRDVEAPEIFSTTDSALWDGRPSLGGIWVASPEVTDPERVVMFNPATGKTVTGALFRRERENPGPRLQLSSDAAEALGILAGQPTEIKVTALRKEEAAPAEAAVAEGEASAADPEASAEGKGAGEAAAIASAALAAVDAESSAPAEGEAATDPAATTVEGAAAADGTVPAVEEKPKKKTWKERRAEAKAAREAKKKAAAEAAAAAAAAAAGAVPEGEAATATAETAGVAAIETAPIESAPLDARKAEVTEAAPEAPAEAAPEPKAEPEAEPEAAPAATDASSEASSGASSGTSRPIQVASFSKEDNAKRAAEALAKIGVTATPQKSDKGGKAVWGVVVMGDDAMLKKIKDAGFADAYFLK